MGIKSGFFDAAYDEQTGEYDRVYLSDDMSIFFDAIVGNGVFKDIGNGLHVIPSGAGMSISVDTGFAVALGRYMKNTEPYVIQVDGADSQARIDLVVARLSTLQNERSFTLIVKKGTPALSPVAPTLVRNEAVYELGLAKINIASGTTSILSSMIEDTRKDEELCGFVSGIGGGNEFIDCTINGSADTYSSAWLFDKDGNAFIPEAGKTYRVITVGTYKNCLYLFNETTNKYEGVGSYEVELTADEILDLWDDSSYSRLSNIPALVSNIEFTGGVVAPSWLYYDPTKVRMAGTTSATNVGTYTTTFEPINGYAWPDGTVDVKYIPWSITKKVVPIPIPTRSQYEYDGTQKTLIFNDVDLSSVTITNVTGTNAGTYTATVSLNNPTNTEWTDGTIAQKAIPMIITKKVIPIPVPTQTQFTYDGNEKTLTFNSLDIDNVTLNNVRATNVGTYSATAILNDSGNMAWSDGTSAPKTFSLAIVKKSIQIPNPVQTQFVYNGEEKTVTFNNLDTNNVVLSGTKGINVNRYSAIATLGDISTMAWSDGTTDQKAWSWEIISKGIQIPTPVQTIFNYDGEEKSVNFNNLDADNVILTNNKATNIGEYSVSGNLKDKLNTVWSDGTVEQKDWSYKIIGRQNVVTLSKGSVTLNDSSDSDNITVSSLSGGAITASVADETIAKVSVSGNTITVVSGKGITRGSTVVTINVAKSGIYEAGTAEFTVVKDYEVKIVTWADGTDEEIVAMVRAADDGIIDLRDYWSVGQRRVITLSPIAASGSNGYGSWNVGESHVTQYATLVLMDTDHYELSTPIVDKYGVTHNKCNFVVGMLNCFKEPGNMHNDASAKVLWPQTTRYTWCNTAFAGAIPSTLISMFKRFKVGSSGQYNNDSQQIQYTNDLFSIFASREILDNRGTGTHVASGNSDEWTFLSQIDYYSRSTLNKTKNLGNDGSRCKYYTRSIIGVESGGNGYAHSIDKDGLSSGDEFYTSLPSVGLAPFGCI